MSEIRETENHEKNIDNAERRNDASREHFESTYELKPNEKYEVNQYRYETDKQGRIKSCEGCLRLEEGKTNQTHQRKAGGEDRLENDDGGHLIARRFGGSEKVDNIVPMDYHLNRGEYKNMENHWADAVERGDNVEVKINCKYEGDSKRPESFNVYYRITDDDGRVVEQGKRRFRNEGQED